MSMLEKDLANDWVRRLGELMVLQWAKWLGKSSAREKAKLSVTCLVLKWGKHLGQGLEMEWERWKGKV